LGNLELARQLRIQVAAAIDVADEVGLGPGRGRRRPVLFRGARSAASSRVVPERALAFELGDGLGVSLDAIAIQLGHAPPCACLSQTARSGVDSCSRRYRAWPSL
jgi:hypothetical protein